MSCRPLGRWMFGKLPVAGDFLSRGLDMARRDALDHWLSGELETARARFPDDFEARYDVAPAWCFVDCDASGQWSGGALCASVDAVGRRFPVLVSGPANDLAEAPGVAGACLERLYAAFAEGWDADRLQGAEQPTVVEVDWTPHEPAWALLGEGGAAVVLPGRFPQGVVTKMVELAA